MNFDRIELMFKDENCTYHGLIRFEIRLHVLSVQRDERAHIAHRITVIGEHIHYTINMSSDYC